MSVLLKDYDAGVLTLTLNRPDKKNAVNVELWKALRDAVLEAREDDRVNVLLLCGAGKDFCAGTDLTEFSDSGEEHPFDSCARAIAAFDKPMVAAAQGVAVGGGATVLFHADVVYVGESLRMRLPFVNLGLVPEFASSYMLQANIGAKKAAELFYTAEWIDAARAVEAGIATRSYADAQLLAQAKAKAAEIAQWPVNSLRETKRTLMLHHADAINKAFDAENAGMMRQGGSPENMEAITAFMEKRQPDFKKLLE